MIFIIKVTTNKEEKATEMVSEKAEKKNLNVFSVSRPHGLRGYIFLEAEDRESAEELLKKELGIEKGSGDQKKMQVANASIEQIILIAKTKFQNLLCKDLKSAVKTVLGSGVSLGILVENKPAVEVIEEVEQGKYKKEIEQEKTETSDDKLNELKSYFEKIKKEQEKLIKAKQEAESEKKEESKTEAKEEPAKKEELKKKK